MTGNTMSRFLVFTNFTRSIGILSGPGAFAFLKDKCLQNLLEGERRDVDGERRRERR